MTNVRSKEETFVMNREVHEHWHEHETFAACLLHFDQFAIATCDPIAANVEVGDDFGHAQIDTHDQIKLNEAAIRAFVEAQAKMAGQRVDDTQAI